jgi:hypothetical protein
MSRNQLEDGGCLFLVNDSTFAFALSASLPESLLHLPSFRCIVKIISFSFFASDKKVRNYSVQANTMIMMLTSFDIQPVM